jgi:hypothetical protein
MLRGVSGFSVFTSRGSVLISSATSNKSLISVNVTSFTFFRFRLTVSSGFLGGFWNVSSSV